jgi:heme-degrading monooxygenase HmoA
MITVANRIFVAQEYAEAFEERFRTRAGLVDDMPGFVSNQVLRPTSPGDPYIVLTLWESRAHFEAWTTSEAFLKGHARSGTLPKDAFTGPNTLEIHEVVLDSTRPWLKPEGSGRA